MSPIKIIAFVLIITGMLGFAYGGFTCAKGNHDADIGQVRFSIKDGETANIPMGVGIEVIGGVLLQVRF